MFPYIKDIIIYISLRMKTPIAVHMTDKIWFISYVTYDM